MTFDWRKFKDTLPGESDWIDAEDLARLSVESFTAKNHPFRRELSTGSLRLTGRGVRNNRASVEGVSAALRSFQRLVVSTGMSIEGHKSLRGQVPLDVLQKTRLNLDGAPLPGSLMLHFVPAMLPEEEIAPSGQTDAFGTPDTQLVDIAVRETISLMEDGRNFAREADHSDFLSRIETFGPRVGSSLREFTSSLAKFEFEPILTWCQPTYPRLITKLEISEMLQIGDAILSHHMEREPATIRGVLRTVSDLSPWIVETAENQRVKIIASAISKADTAKLRTGMLVEVNVSVVEEYGPASDVKPSYTATGFKILSTGEVQSRITLS